MASTGVFGAGFAASTGVFGAGVPPVGIAAGSMAYSALMTLPVALFQLPETVTLRSGLSVAALGLLGTGIAFWIFYTLIAGVGAGPWLLGGIAAGFAAFGGYALARARYPDRDPSS